MKTLIAAGVLAVTVLPVHAMADSPFDGTWKADVSSAQMPKAPDVFVLAGGMYSCKTCAPGYSIKADGTDQAVAGHPYYDTVAIKIVDAHTIQETDKKGGKTVTSSTVTIAGDGKTGTFDFTDSSNSSAAPVTGKGMIKQVAAGPSGSHAVSGSWITTSFSGMSDNGVTVTYKVDGGMLSMNTPTGQTYTAKMDGTPAPFKGDPGVTTVSVKMMGARTMEETDMRDGKVVSTATSTASADGKSLSVVYHDMLRGGRKTAYMETKQ
ncbi:MAG TPA: hypothetical protein VGF97_08245 [Rhizomicrobium sp.]